MDIKKVIQMWMRQEGVNAVGLADRLGISRQRIYSRLDPDRKPNFRSVYEMVGALGKTGIIKRRGQSPEMLTMKDLLRATDEQQLSFETVERLLNALGYEIVFMNTKDSKQWNVTRNDCRKARVMK